MPMVMAMVMPMVMPLGDDNVGAVREANLMVKTGGVKGYNSW